MAKNKLFFAVKKDMACIVQDVAYNLFLLYLLSSKKVEQEAKEKERRIKKKANNSHS